MEVKEEPMTLQDLEILSDFSDIQIDSDPLSLDGAQEKKMMVAEILLDTKYVIVKQEWEDDSCCTSEPSIEEFNEVQIESDPLSLDRVQEMMVAETLLDAKNVSVKQEWEDDTCFTSELSIEDINNEYKMGYKIQGVSNNVIGKIETQEENTDFTSTEGCLPLGISDITGDGDSFQKDNYENKERFRCSLCTKSFSTRYYLLEHKRSHDRAFRCPTCKKAFSCKRGLTEHLCGHIGVNRCKICQKSFYLKKSLLEHVKTHGDTFKYSVYRKSLSNKRNRFGARVEVYKCSVCKRSFSSSRTLEQHVKIHEGLFFCSICEKSWSSNQALLEHMRDHKDANRCPICQVSVSTKHTLKRHMLGHEGSFKCSVCEESFTGPNSVKESEGVHNGPQNVCSLCSKNYSLRRGPF